MVALSRDRKQYLIGEYKFKGQPFRYGEYLDTTAKLTPLKGNDEFFYALFSESGFDERASSRRQSRTTICGCMM